MRHATLAFLIKEHTGQTVEVCLGMKRVRLGKGKWNGAGGKLEPGETIWQCGQRETHEELGVHATELRKVAEVTFLWPTKPTYDQVVHVFFVPVWDGIPADSDELSPIRWFPVTELPLGEMWEADALWLPAVIRSGALLRGEVVYDDAGRLMHREFHPATAACPQCGCFLRDVQITTGLSADQGQEFLAGHQCPACRTCYTPALEETHPYSHVVPNIPDLPRLAPRQSP